MTVRGVSPKVRKENKRRFQQQQEYFEQRAQSVRQTLRDIGRQDLVDDLDRAKQPKKDYSLLWAAVIVLVLWWLSL